MLWLMHKNEGLIYQWLTLISIASVFIVVLNKKNICIYTLESLPLFLSTSLTCWRMVPENVRYIHYENTDDIFVRRTVSDIY